MSHNPSANEIVRTLTSAVRHALEPSDAQSLPAARDVAQILGFDGLDRALSVWRTGDPGTEPIARQLRALCDRSEAEASIEPFIAADPDLGRLAVECGSVVEGEPGLPPEGTLGAIDAIGELRLDDEASRAAASRVRLSPQVSAAMRAAIDWLYAEQGHGPGARMRTEDSALELTFPRVNPAGLDAAGKVLAAVGGNLGPAGAQRGASAPWVLRVPIVTLRETFLMISQGDLDLALPWHAVLRVTMTPRTALDSGISDLGHPVVSPLVSLSDAEADYPIILVAHGLRRGYVVADRLVWRLPAEEVEGRPDPRAPGHPRCVRTEDGAIHRVADPARLLEGVDPIAIPDGGPSFGPVDSERAAAPGPALGEVIMPVAQDTVTAVPSATLRAVAIAANDEARLDPESHHLPEASFHGLPAAGATAVPALETARVTPLPLRALVAEDSISARLSLVQMLEGHGLEVHAVGTRAELFEALDVGPWALVCVDVELPDGRGVEMLSAARNRAREQDENVAVVALVRDGAEAAVAIEASVVYSLDKPYGRAAVARLMTDLDLESEPT